MLDEYVLVFCRWTIGLTFAVSAWGKALDLGAFREAVRDFGLLPRRLSGPAATTFFAAEVLVVVLMVLGGSIGLTAGFALAVGLLVLFAVALSVALSKKAGVACNCFGRTERRVSWYDVGRNGVLVACSGAGLWAYAAYAQQASFGISGVLLSGFMAASFVLILMNLGDVVEILRRPHTLR